MNARRIKARGQAVLELSLLLIVMIPIIFYSLFLDDLLRHRLDMLEAVVSSPWDMTGIDQESSNGGDVSSNERHAWCDHTYTYNSYDVDYECDNDGSRHHKAFAAHVCWIVEGGQQIECSRDANTPNIDSDADYNGGGVTTCSARAGVFNYFIVQQAMAGFTQMDKLTKAEHMSGGVHSHYGAASANIFMLERQQFAVLHDDWALKLPGDMDAAFDIMSMIPGGLFDTGFKSRVKTYYDKNAKFDDADDFFEKLDDEKLIKDTADDDGFMGDNPKTLHLSFNKEPGHDFGVTNKHPSSAWSDSRVSGTHGAREDSYFGVSESTW